jgi:hypothetical protein
MNANDQHFELSSNIEHYLRMLSKIYGNNGNELLQKVIVNSQVRVEENTRYDSWEGGVYGHSLHLYIPEDIYLNLLSQKGKLQENIKKDLNEIHNISNEYIKNVFFDMESEEGETNNWRSESGLLMAGKRVVSSKATDRIWEKGNFRVFFSHKAAVKKETALLKDKLSVFGISCFVAHEDIHPTQEWQDEIENALFSMDALVALMTDNFHDSEWTDQEVGVAFGREVPIIPVKLGKDPYGFIGKFQALSCSWDDAPSEIIKLLLKHEKMRDAYIRAVHKCSNWDNGNILAKVLPEISELSDEHVNNLIDAFNKNSNVHDAWGFNGEWKTKHGNGLIHHLERITKKKFSKTSQGIIEATE